MQSNNRSGVLGVRETMYTRPSGRIDIYAHAFVRIDNKCVQKKFNYSKYGKQKAWTLAKQWREDMFKKCLGENYDL